MLISDRQTNDDNDDQNEADDDISDRSVNYRKRRPAHRDVSYEDGVMQVSIHIL